VGGLVFEIKSLKKTEQQMSGVTISPQCMWN